MGLCYLLLPFQRALVANLASSPADGDLKNCSSATAPASPLHFLPGEGFLPPSENSALMYSFDLVQQDHTGKLAIL